MTESVERALSATFWPLFPTLRVGVVNIGGSVAVVVVPLKPSPIELEDSLPLFAMMSITSFSVSEAISLAEGLSVK